MRSMKRVAHKARGFDAARNHDLAQQHQMTPDERRAVAKTLRDRAYGTDAPDVRQAHRAK